MSFSQDVTLSITILVGLIFLACLFKLVAQPVLVSWFSDLFSFQDLWREILTMEAPMPTAAMTAVFARRYGCDAELTSILVFATFISSVFTMIMIILLLS